MSYPVWLRLTDGNAVVPPVVGALLEDEAKAVFDVLPSGWCRQGPRPEVDEHH